MDLEIDGLFIGTMSIGLLKAKTDGSWCSNVTVGNTLVQFKLDTGAEANVLPLQVFRSMESKARCEERAELCLKPTKTVLTAYGGARLKPEGMLTLMCYTPKSQANLTFYVSRHSPIPILGRKACEEVKKTGYRHVGCEAPSKKGRADSPASSCV